VNRVNTTAEAISLLDNIIGLGGLIIVNVVVEAFLEVRLVNDLSDCKSCCSCESVVASIEAINKEVRDENLDLVRVLGVRINNSVIAEILISILQAILFILTKIIMIAHHIFVISKVCASKKDFKRYIRAVIIALVVEIVVFLTLIDLDADANALVAPLQEMVEDGGEVNPEEIGEAVRELWDALVGQNKAAIVARIAEFNLP